MPIKKKEETVTNSSILNLMVIFLNRFDTFLFSKLEFFPKIFRVNAMVLNSKIINFF